MSRTMWIVSSRRGPEAGDDQHSPPPRPTWVRVALILGAVLVLVLIVGLITGGHGPGRHLGRSVGVDASPVASAITSP